MPPAWVPSFPPLADLRSVALAPAGAAAAAPAASARARRQRARPRRLLVTGALCALAAAGTVAGLDARPQLERLAGLDSHAPARTPAALAAPAPAPADPAPGASTSVVSVAPSGSTIEAVRYPSAALGGDGSFLVYLPPGFSLGSGRYPVLYLLHGTNESAASFLELGLGQRLDTLIGERAVAPLIAVMIQGGRGTNNWRDTGGHRYESYVLEVQQLVDRLYPTLRERGARAIAGYSMGGFGAMNIALGHPDRFAVVESWLGFFNGLGGELRAARATIARSGLRAFVYGAASDVLVDPTKDAPFAAALREAGADAASAVYAGGHTMVTLEQHLTHMLAFAGEALATDRRSASAPA
jgi:enterochelin esterase-like enzyme